MEAAGIPRTLPKIRAASRRIVLVCRVDVTRSCSCRSRHTIAALAAIRSGTVCRASVAAIGVIESILAKDGPFIIGRYSIVTVIPACGSRHAEAISAAKAVGTIPRASLVTSVAIKPVFAKDGLIIGAGSFVIAPRRACGSCHAIAIRTAIRL